MSASLSSPASPLVSEEGVGTAPQPPTEPLPAAGPPTQPLWRVVVLLSSGFLAAWLAFSPYALDALAFLAPAPWVWLVLDGRRLTWGAMLATWVIATIYWLSLGIWSPGLTAIAWSAALLTAMLLGGSFVAFMVLSRSLRRRLQLPVWIVCPVVWVAVEELRSELLGGFALGYLGHSVVRIEWLIQLGSIGGTMLLSGLIVAITASATQLIWGVRHYLNLSRLLEQMDGEESPAGARVVPFSDRLKPTIDFSQIDDSVVADGSGQASVGESRVDQRAMQRTLLRVHDRARTDDLRSPLFAAVMLVLLLGLSFLYGRQRLLETSQWKLFEGNQLRLAAASPELTLNDVAVWARSDHLGPIDLLISRQPLSGESAHDWEGKEEGSVSTLRRNEGHLRQLSATLGAPGSSDLVVPRMRLEYIGEDRPARTIDLAPFGRRWAGPLLRQGGVASHIQADADLRLNLFGVVGSLKTLEHDQCGLLRGMPDGGMSVDAIVWFGDDAPPGGGLWQHLVSRAAFASAAANRCSLLVLWPDGFSTMISCGTMQSFDPASHRFADRSTASMLVDPRGSQFHGGGYLLGTACVVLIVLAYFGEAMYRRWGQSRNQQAILIPETETSPPRSLLGVPRDEPV